MHSDGNLLSLKKQQLKVWPAKRFLGEKMCKKKKNFPGQTFFPNFTSECIENYFPGQTFNFFPSALKKNEIVKNSANLAIPSS